MTSGLPAHPMTDHAVWAARGAWAQQQKEKQ
jgi:hypothetical protein